MKIVVTGVGGLIGRHTAIRLHARNCAARFGGRAAPYELSFLDRAAFLDTARLREAVAGASAILHFAGVNRASDEVVEAANPAIAQALVSAIRDTNVAPHIVYANSTHAIGDSPYGRGKRRAGEILASAPGPYTDLILPHIFGEGAKPHYNNVTATFIDQVINGEDTTVDPNGQVHLLHAGAAAQQAIEVVLDRNVGQIVPQSRPTPVPELLEMLHGFHSMYTANVYPDLRDTFGLTLFNSYRTALYPDGFPRPLKLNVDDRGVLFEAAKGGGGGQTFLSWTEPGVTRGDHFHLFKVERFLVLQGEAVIRIRRVLDGPLWEYRVSGDTPMIVDMPTLHTHSIENVGSERMLTMFWSHDIHDPTAPDTYSDPVLEDSYA